MFGCLSKRRMSLIVSNRMTLLSPFDACMVPSIVSNKNGSIGTMLIVEWVSMFVVSSSSISWMVLASRINSIVGTNSSLAASELILSMSDVMMHVLFFCSPWIAPKSSSSEPIFPLIYLKWWMIVTLHLPKLVAHRKAILSCFSNCNL